MHVEAGSLPAGAPETEAQLALIGKPYSVTFLFCRAASITTDLSSIDLCRTRPALSLLKDMQEEAGSLPAGVPETEAVLALIERAAEWQARAAALAAQKAPLKKMREVLHLGLRMPVEVPQVESLRAEIRRREWEDSAKKV